MTCPDCQSRLDDLIDGELNAADLARMENHLAACPSCRHACAALRDLLARTAALPKAILPRRDLWPEIRARVADGHSVPASAPSPTTRWIAWGLPLATAAAIAIMATLADRVASRRDTGPGWPVATVTGAPQVAARVVGRDTSLRLGQWLETDRASRARVAVGTIGEVTVDPNSRLRLVGVAERDHRIELQRGTLNAIIWAPPRLFFVDTPSATAVDLGCAYTLTVDPDGNGTLAVSAGYVALEHDGRSSITPWGMTCLTRRGAGPGTPFANNAPDALRRALFRFDFEAAAAASVLAEILAHARGDDAVTLWHLLARTTGDDRRAVFHRLEQLAAPPDGVTRDGILSLDAAMLARWGTMLGLGGFEPR